MEEQIKGKRVKNINDIILLCCQRNDVICYFTTNKYSGPDITEKFL